MSSALNTGAHVAAVSTVFARMKTGRLCTTACKNNGGRGRGRQGRAAGEVSVFRLRAAVPARHSVAKTINKAARSFGRKANVIRSLQ
eukprot:6498763-Pyramimonas_sp.AAC.1